MAIKRKTTTAIVAGVTAVALLLGGTFAWTSISQRAKNETIVDINPGGRLHDDFNGTNKDVYVENFGDEDTGVPIFARIRLDEYMEVGPDAGINRTNADRAVDVVKPDDYPADKTLDINDVTSWVTYIPGDDDTTNPAVENKDRKYGYYWDWQLGNTADHLPYYMPTFNKNKDSLKADINGTYEGSVQGDIVHYDDYREYDADDAITKDATYDWDEDTVEDYARETRNENTAFDTVDVLKKEETHDATPISTTALVITMDEWINTYNSEPGDYWVYDTDGWAYWANTIEPGKTTGLLLDGISMSKTPSDTWYYAINVVAQFATKSDFTAFTADGISDNALDLLAAAADLDQGFVLSGPATVFTGDTYNFSAALKKAGVAANTQPTGITYSVAVDGATTALADADAISIDANTGVLTVPADAPHNTKITVTATSTDPAYTATFSATVLNGYETLKTATVGQKVGIDGIEYWVLKNDGDKALIWAAEAIGDRTTYSSASSTNSWESTWARSYLNGDWLTAQPTLSKHAMKATIYTANVLDRTGKNSEYIETTDKVFLLSEADLFDMANRVDVKNSKEYTTGEFLDLPASIRAFTPTDSTYPYAWLRSPRDLDTAVALVDSDGNVNAYGYGASAYYRPAMWVCLDEFIEEIKATTVGSENTVNIDGIDWYVVANQDSKFLLWASEAVGDPKRFDDDSPAWNGSEVQAYLNSDSYINSTLPALKPYLPDDNVIYTANNFDRNATDFGYDETNDKVFLLSEADLFDRAGAAAVKDVKEYTTGAYLNLSDDMKNFTAPISYNYCWAWLRSPYNSQITIAVVTPSGGSNYSGYTNGYYLRPAVWVNVDTVVTPATPEAEETPQFIEDIKATTVASTNTVNIDGIDWYVVAAEDNKALLWASQPLASTMAFDSDSVAWKGSDIQTHLNGTFLDTLTTLQPYLPDDNVIYTAKSYKRADGYDETNDKVFLLSEADLFDTANNGTVGSNQEYTTGKSLNLPTSVISFTEPDAGYPYAWLRSPCNSPASVAINVFDGTGGSYNVGDAHYVRPAVWVNLD